MILHQITSYNSVKYYFSKPGEMFESVFLITCMKSSKLKTLSINY